MSDRCYLTCTECGRACNGVALGRVTHRFDCCGEIRAHVPSRDGSTWFRSGMEAGYMTGPSRTKAPARSSGSAAAVT